MQNIRKMLSTDIDKVLSIERENEYYPWTEQIFEDCLEVGYDAYVAEIGYDIIGFMFAQFINDECHVLNICIAKDHQHQGHATALFEYLYEKAEQNFAKIFLLEVRVTNNKAISFYKKQGFKEISTRKDYYRAKNGREDAIIMRLDMK